MIEADTKAQALKKAQAIGEGEHCAYRAQEGDDVTWEFVQVERIFEPLDEEIRDKTEVFSRFLRKSEAESLLTPFGDEDEK